jgi:arginase
MNVHTHCPLTELEVIGVRYRGTKFAGPDHAALEAYLGKSVYTRAGVPFSYSEPRMPEGEETGRAEVDLGTLGGVIAKKAAEGRNAGKQLLMTGGNCNHATGILGGLQTAHGADSRIGLVWFDAHGDFNTPRTTLTGSLGGMPVAVSAGLALREWREGSLIHTPVPTDRIILTDMRNLDPPEKNLINATDAVIARMVPGRPGADLAEAVRALSDRVDMIYLHIDADILDREYVPHHGTVEPDGPDMAQVLKAAEVVLASGKVAALALVSVYFGGEADRDIESGVALLDGILPRWAAAGTVR